MAALIKNALIKQISKYLKNVSANQINISTFKGEGEMTNIQLDENVLMDLLELPTWLRITSARCNKAGVKIPWTKLKTNPIVIALDKIELEMEITDQLREYKPATDKIFDKDAGGAYGFIDKCIDAMQLNIESISITIKSNIFNANLSISNIFVYSTTPNWKTTGDIRNTRLKDLEKEEIIVYKEISWEICRLEAYNIELQQQQQQATSIKLIMNPSKVRIAMKKKLSDKSLINSTVRVLLNEIYWMANDTQMKSAFSTYNMLSKYMKKASIQKRKYANVQLSQQTSSNKPTTSSAQSPNAKTANSTLPNQANLAAQVSKVFQQYDLKETSLHLQICMLNIHLYADDNYSGNALIDGGAMQILFKDLCIDHYPYHRIGESIKHWNNYDHIFKQREDWSKALIEQFTQKLINILDKSESLNLNRIRLRNSLNLLESCTILTLKDFTLYKVTTNMSNTMNKSSKKHTAKSNEPKQFDEFMNDSTQTPNDFLKTKEFFIHQQNFNKRPFLSTNFVEFSLPSDTIFAHFFFSEFYFAQECNYPIPSPQVYAHLAPILLNVDFLTLLWINTLMLSLYREKLIADQNKQATTTTTTTTTTTSNQHSDSSQKLKSNQTSSSMNSATLSKAIEKPMQHVDTFVQVLTPKINLTIYSSEMMNKMCTPSSFTKRPIGIEIGFAQISASNQFKPDLLKNKCDRFYDSSRLLCKMNSQKFSNQTFVNQTFVNQHQHQSELRSIAPCVRDLIQNENLQYVRYDLSTDLINTKSEACTPQLGLFLKSLTKNVLNKNASKDVWCIDFESMWLDFLMDDKSENNKQFVKNTSFNLWLVNVWDFYKSQLFKVPQDADDLESASETCDSADLLDEELVSVHGGIQVESSKEKMEKEFAKLKKVIQIPSQNESRQTRSNSLSVSSSLALKHQNSKYLWRQIYSTLNVFVWIEQLGIDLDHSNLLFIMRLVDTVDLFSEQMKLDAEQTLKYQNLKDNNNNVRADEETTSSRLASLDTKRAIQNESQAEEEKREEEEEEETSVNLALAINKIKVELTVNDHRKVAYSEIIKELQESQSRDSKLADTSSTANNQSSHSNRKATTTTHDSFEMDSTPNKANNRTDSMNKSVHSIGSKSTNSMREELDQIGKQMDKEFIRNYLRFLYGLSSDNPNLRSSFTNFLLEESMSNSTNLTTTTTSSGIGTSSSDLSVKPKSMSFSYSAASNSTLTILTPISQQVQQQQQQQQATTKATSSFLSSLKNIGNKARQSTQQIQQQVKEQIQVQNKEDLIDNSDLFADDNDNLSVILSLDKEDTLSLYSVDVSTQSNNIEQLRKIQSNQKFPLLNPLLLSQTISVSSSSSSSLVQTPASSGVQPIGVQQPARFESVPTQSDVDQLLFSPNQLISSHEETSNEVENKQTVPESSGDQTNNPLDENKEYQTNQTQTVQTRTRCKVELNTLDLYLQVQTNKLNVLLKFDELNLQNKKSIFKDLTWTQINASNGSNSRNELNEEDEEEEEIEIESSEINTKCDILVKFKKLDADPMSKNGLVEVLLENFSLSIDKPIVDGLVDFVDDDDFFNDFNKPSLPVNIRLNNCQFTLTEKLNEIEKRPLVVYIKQLAVDKLENSEIVIRNFVQFEHRLAFVPHSSLISHLNSLDLKRVEKKRRKSVDYLDLMRSRQIINETPHQFRNCEQFASLVHLLRKSKEENAQLRSDLEKLGEESQTKEELKRLQELLEMYKKENDVLKSKLDSTQVGQNSSMPQNLIDF